MTVAMCRTFIAATSRAGEKLVMGPHGTPLSIADLPQPGTHRWVIRRKAEIVAAVRGGLLSLEDACSRYALTVEEFLAWQRSLDSHGLRGLRTTRYQQYRDQGPGNCRPAEAEAPTGSDGKTIQEATA
jgi:hypothetical protein